MKPQKIQIEATISAPLSKVWSYWTKPEHIMQWNFAIPEWHCPKVVNNVEDRGRYYARMEARDGSFGFDFEAIYDLVVPERKLKYTILDGREVVTTFEQVGSSTKLTTVFDAESQNPIDMQKDGWQAILNNFKKYTEAK